MKRLEMVVPDAMLRQVLVLVADQVPELHVYDVPEKAKPVLALTPPAAKIAKGPPTPAFRPVVTARTHILDYLREHGTARSGELDKLGSDKGFSPNTFGVQAAHMRRVGLLMQDQEGLYRLPPTPPSEETK